MPLSINLLLVLVLCSSLGCSEEDKLIEPSTGSVSGRVTHAIMGWPLDGVSVSLNGSVETTHDTFGTYSFNQVPTGSHTITFTKPDFDTENREISVTGNNNTSVDVDLRPSLDQGKGMVLFIIWEDVTIDDLENVRVSCGGVVGYTDSGGIALLVNVPEGNRVFSATKQGYTEVSSTVNVTAGQLSDVRFGMELEPVSQTVTIYSTKDTYVSSAQQDTNFGTSNVLKLAPEGSFDGEYRIYVYFDLSSIPDDVTIEDAMITMENCGGSTNNSSTVATCGALMLNKANLFLTSNFNWTETGLTWSSSLNTDVTNLMGSGWLFNIYGPSGDLNSAVTLDIEAYVNDYSGYVDTYSGWIIECYSGSGGDYGEYKTFYSSDWSAVTRPKLTVTYH